MFCPLTIDELTLREDEWGVGAVAVAAPDTVWLSDPSLTEVVGVEEFVAVADSARDIVVVESRVNVGGGVKDAVVPLTERLSENVSDEVCVKVGGG